MVGREGWDGVKRDCCDCAGRRLINGKPGLPMVIVRSGTRMFRSVTIRVISRVEGRGRGKRGAMFVYPMNPMKRCPCFMSVIGRRGVDLGGM